MIFLALLLLGVPSLSWARPHETAYNEAFCDSVGGETQKKNDYRYPTGKTHVYVDCETADTVYEGGLDKTPSSQDSVHQALFAAYLTDKKPVVVIYDTDGRMGKYEYQVKGACERAKIRFINDKQVHFRLKKKNGSKIY